MKRWVKSDYQIKWVWQRSRLRGGPEGYYEVIHKATGRTLMTHFPTKKWAEHDLADFLRKANKLRKEAEAKGIKID